MASLDNEEVELMFLLVVIHCPTIKYPTERERARERESGPFVYS